MDIPDGMRFYSPETETIVGKNRLPHWNQEGSTYFLTFRLADSISAEMLRTHRLEEAAWLPAHPEPWTTEVEAEYLRTFTGRVEHCCGRHFFKTNRRRRMLSARNVWGG